MFFKLQDKYFRLFKSSTRCLTAPQIATRNVIVIRPMTPNTTSITTYSQKKNQFQSISRFHVEKHYSF